MLRNYHFHLRVKILVLLKLLLHFRIIFVILPTPHYYQLLFFILNYNTKCSKCQSLSHYLISFPKQSISIPNARTKIVVQSFILKHYYFLYYYFIIIYRKKMLVIKELFCGRVSTAIFCLMRY